MIFSDKMEQRNKTLNFFIYIILTFYNIVPKGRFCSTLFRKFFGMGNFVPNCSVTFQNTSSRDAFEKPMIAGKMNIVPLFHIVPSLKMFRTDRPMFFVDSHVERQILKVCLGYVFQRFLHRILFYSNRLFRW